MATIRKKGDFQWSVQIRKKGYPPVVKTFANKTDAEAFAREVESAMIKGSYQAPSTLIITE